MFGFIQRHRRLAIAFIAVASLSFVFWMFSVSDLRQMLTGSSCVAVVKGDCVDIREFRFELSRYSELLNNPGMREAVKRLVLSSLITRKVLAKKAEEMGWLVSDEEVLEAIKGVDVFKENGEFSPKRYREVLERWGFSPKEYEDIVREILMARRVSRFLEAGVYVLSDEAQLQRAFELTRLSGKLYLLKPELVPLSYNPSEEEIRKYYEENKERFRERQRSVRYVWVLKDKERVKEYYERIKGGELPEGYRRADELELPASVLHELENLSDEERLKVLKEGEEYYILYLYKVPSGIKPLEEVREEIVRALVEEKKREKLRE
ncbi:MAG: hypothetical protein GXO04_06310, partial [Aquificae bacterium]|nr:hypothetical protein [Aquificota bacterium]